MSKQNQTHNLCSGNRTTAYVDVKKFKYNMIAAKTAPFQMFE
jgi:hypothetical protein